MMYQVEFVKDGRRFATPTITESQKNVFIQELGLKEDDYTILERPDKLWHCAKVVFDLQLIDAAKKAAKEKKDMAGLYTFGDPECLAKIDEAVKVQCTDGRIKNAYVVGIWLATAQEIHAFKDRIGYKKLGIVTKQIKGGK